MAIEVYTRVEFSDFNHEPQEPPMTKTMIDRSELPAKQDGGDVLRSVAEAVLQLIMEADIDSLIRASKHERAEQRTTWRNGYLQ